jgi:hypothetical protein
MFPINRKSIKDGGCLAIVRSELHIIIGLSLFFGDLRGQVVLELTSSVVKLELHHQRSLVGHVQSDLVGETSSL